MTRRAFIRCPLEAALAVKNFGFKFITNGDSLLIPDEYIYEEAGNYLCYGKSKRYISPDSLPLLEPKKDDLYAHDCACGWLTTSPSVDWLRQLGHFRIIQRDGKPFPKVEWEEIV